jgi:hypothetical protein
MANSGASGGMLGNLGSTGTLLDEVLARRATGKASDG